jgi:hypothetical protein
MKLNDQSEMPFGKHKGLKMEKVPARYLLWLWDNGVWAEKEKPIHQYIKDSFSCLETECTDYIVQHPIK